MDNICLICGSPMYRYKRNLFDRTINLFVEVKRYRCSDYNCGFTTLKRVNRKKDELKKN